MRTEIKEKRTVSQKHFQNEDGSKTLKSHVGHIHYFNKKEVGDGKAGFRSIDMQLEWNESKKGWEFLYHSFNPFIPEYANDWADFRDLYDDKDQTISYLPKCKRVLGRLVESIEGVTETNAVIYDNAFGEGFDLIYYFSRTQMKKVVRIRDKFKPTTDISFDFGIKFSDPTMKVIRSFDDKHEYELDISKPKTFDSARQTKIQKRNITNDKLENNTFLKEFKCWDSGTSKQEVKEESIKVDLLVTKQGVSFRKNITANFLKNSNGDVFTDTTTTYYSGAGDGIVQSPYSTTWSTARDAATGAYAYHTQTNIEGIRLNSGNFSIIRSYFPFDTSGIPDSDVISAATYSVYVHSTPTDTSDAVNIHVAAASQASVSSISTSDFDAVGDTSFGSVPIPTTAGSIDFTLNASGLAHINKTGYTKLSNRSDRDIDNSPPTTGTLSIAYRFANYSGTAQDPTLEVTYAPGGGGGGFVPTPMLQMLQVTGGII